VIFSKTKQFGAMLSIDGL